MVQLALRIIAVAAISIRILRPHCFGQGTRRGQRLSPGIVGILHDDIAVGVVQPNDVPLAVIQVVVLRAVQVHGQQRAIGVVAVVDGVCSVRLVRDPTVYILVVTFGLAVAYIFIPDCRPV